MKTLFNFTPRRADAWTELVFEHRNHDYGAYTLRRDYNRNTQKAFSLTTLGILLLFATLWLATRSIDPIVDTKTKKGYTTIDVFDVPKMPASQKPSQPKQRSSGSLANAVITDDIDSADAKIDTTTAAGSTSGSGSTGVTDTTGTGTGSGGGGVLQPDTTTFANKIIEFPEVMPAFPGGMDAMMRYLSKNIRCQSWQENGESGVVVLSLIIDNDGRVKDVQIVRDGVGYGCAEQAAQVVRTMPRWSPGRMGERAVNVRYLLPVRYEKN